MKKNPCSNAGDVDLIPGLGQFPGEGNDNPLQCSCLENPTDRGAWWAVVHCILKSQTRLSDNNNKAKESGAYPVWGCTGKPKFLCDSLYFEFGLLWWSGSKSAVSLRISVYLSCFPMIIKIT